jgi:TPR repeat protein
LGSGDGVPRNLEEAAIWLRRAAAQGERSAQHNIATRYYYGSKGVARDRGEAARLFRLAAEQGCAHAACALAQALCNGDGIPQDYGEAASWYRRAAEQDDDDESATAAHFGLAMLHIKGEGVPLDHAEALRLAGLAAEQGHAGAQLILNDLGPAFRCGHTPGPRPLIEAERAYQLAAAQAEKEGDAADKSALQALEDRL